MKRNTFLTLACTFVLLLLAYLYWPKNNGGDGGNTSVFVEKVSRLLGGGNNNRNGRPDPEDVYETPFEFYGKVIDENGGVVEGAKITMTVFDGIEHSTDYIGTSDSRGLFAIKCKKGSGFTVAVTRHGYHVLTEWQGRPDSTQRFNRNPEFRFPYISNKEQPTVFALKKHGIIEPLTSVGKPETLNKTRFSIKLNGEPTSAPIYIDGKKSDRNLIVKCWVPNGTAKNTQGTFSWNCEIAVQNGVLAERADKMEFVAPADGYAERVLINLPDSTPRRMWDDGVTKTLFVRFNDGIYARVEIAVTVPNTQGRISGYLNPKPGSRFLETESGQ